MTDESNVTRLRRAVIDDPRNAQLRYLLGAEMAQERDYESAVMEWSAAIALDPLLHVARLQLGLLHLTMARLDHARAVLAPLEDLDDSMALKQFKRGLEALIEDNFTACAAHLRAGIELNTDNPPLNADMQMLLGKAMQAMNADAAPVGDASIRHDFSLYSTTRH